MTLREILLALSLFVGLALVVSGVALWSIEAALIIAGIGVVAIGLLLLVEVE